MKMCDVCGFDRADYRRNDVATAPRWLNAMADEVLEGATHEVRSSVGPMVQELRDLAARLGDAPVDGALHDGVHLLRTLGRALHEAGGGVQTQEGVIAQISASDGGIPKASVLAADVTRRGIVGDRQANRKHHGRPFQALCLWSTEVLAALAAEGHPITAGAAGENITISGLDWSAIRPGARVLLGEVSCELSAWSVPCRKNDQWFTGRSDRIDHTLHPGWSRVYAWVIEPGAIRVGDRVIVEP